jgi:WD40 repeat protein
MSSDEESLSSSYNSEDDNQDHDQEQDQGADQDQDVENKNDGAEEEEEEEATPNTITFDSPIVSVEFHNSADKIACGLMDGVVALYEYGLDANKELWNLSLHDKALRDLRFSDDGTHLYTVSSDRALKVTDVETSKLIYEIDKAHKTAINCVGCADQFVFTGDDDGVVKVWDMRKKGPVFEWKENTEYISGFAHNHTKRILLAPSGDGTLAVFSYRKGKLEALSDNMEDELLNTVIVKNGKKAITGGQTGCLWIWSWGDWGDVTDRFTGHPDSIDKIIKYDEDTILTGSSDGLIRVVTIHPNKLLGVVGQHEDYPADKLAMSRDRKYLASCPSESTLKFWGIDFFKRT